MNEISNCARTIEVLNEQIHNLHTVIGSFGREDPNAFAKLKSLTFEKNKFGSTIEINIPDESSDAFFSAVLPYLRRLLSDKKSERIRVKQKLASLLEADLN